MFKINDVVITPNEMPAIIVEVYGNGMSYVVDEMPNPSQNELKTMDEFASIENTYSHEQLRIPTQDEQKRLDFLIEGGCTFPTMN